VPIYDVFGDGFYARLNPRGLLVIFFARETCPLLGWVLFPRSG